MKVDMLMNSDIFDKKFFVIKEKFLSKSTSQMTFSTSTRIFVDLLGHRATVRGRVALIGNI